MLPPQVGTSGQPELLPREEHERLYLSRAAAEGREAPARAFLAALQAIMRGVARPAGAGRPATAAAVGRLRTPPPSQAVPAARSTADAPPLVEPSGRGAPQHKCGSAPRLANARVNDGWEDPREKRRMRRRRLWAGGSDGAATDGSAGASNAPSAAPSAGPSCVASIGPTPPGTPEMPPVVPVASLPSTAHLNAVAAAAAAPSLAPARAAAAMAGLRVEVAGAATEHSDADEMVEATGACTGVPVAGMSGASTPAPPSTTSPSSRERIIPAWRAWRDETITLALSDVGGHTTELLVGASVAPAADAESLTVSSVSGSHKRRKRRPPPPASFLPTTPTTPRSERDEGDASQRGSPSGRVGGSLKEKILAGSAASPPRDADAMREAAERRHARAEAQRERLAAEEASRLRAQREREEAVRGRKVAAAAEKRRALEEKLARAEAARGESLGGVVSRARTENQKVEEVAFINKVKDDVDEREAQRARTLAAEAAYARWTAAIEQRASRAAEAAKRREQVRLRGRGAVATEQAALRLKAHQRSVDANQRRLVLVQALLQQRRERAERREAAVQELRERRGASDGEMGAAEVLHADEARSVGGRAHRRTGNCQRSQRRNVRGLASVSEASLDSAAALGVACGGGTRSSDGTTRTSAPLHVRSLFTITDSAAPGGSFEHEGAFGPLYASETDHTEGEAGAPTGELDSALAAGGPPAPSQQDSATTGSHGRRSALSQLSEEELETRRRLRARTKRIRSRMAASAVAVRMDQLDWLWVSATGTQASKRLMKLAHALSEVSGQPQSDGAAATAWEVCKMLEGGRERELHAARQQGILESLVELAAGPAEGGGWPSPPRRSTQVAATRALLAACALPCNRSYLLLRNHAAGLATFTLACAVEAATHDARAGRADAMGFDADVYAEDGARADGLQSSNLLLPLLQLLRLLIATPPPTEAARRLRSDLVTLLIASGGMHSLQEYCTARAATLAQATAHGALLEHYVGLLHALLLPLRDDPSNASCATALRELLRETRLCGVPGLACAMLVEATHPDGGLTPRDRCVDLPVAGGPGRVLPGAQVLSVCRLAVQLLAHVGSIDAPLLRRALGAGELKAQLLHLVHLALDLFADTGDCTAGSGSTSADDRARAEEVRALLHELLLLLGIFTHGSRANAELLRWRKGEHPTMLHRLVSLPFAYFCVPRLRAVLLPTLLCGCFRELTNTRILAAHLHPQHLVRFLREEMAAAPGAHAATPAALLVADPSQFPTVTMDYGLAARLPPSEWEAALQFFEAPPEPPSSPRRTPATLTPISTPGRASPLTLPTGRKEAADGGVPPERAGKQRSDRCVKQP